MVKYDPKQGKLCSFYDALPQFFSGNDNPRSFLERCLKIISEKEPLVQAFVTMDQKKLAHLPIFQRKDILMGTLCHQLMVCHLR